MLTIEHLAVTYGAVEAVHDASLEVQEGSITALLGPNGAGKTTILRAVAGIARVTRGRVLLGDMDITNKPTRWLIEQGIFYQPETRELFPSMTVRENLFATARAMPAARRQARLDAVLDGFPRLKDRMDQVVSTMSGGEQQMVAVGRAFLANPRLLLLDEPSLGLAPKMVEEVFHQIRTLQDSQHLTVLIAEQNTRVSLATASWAYFVRGGVITYKGAAHELIGKTDIHHYYLG